MYQYLQPEPEGAIFMKRSKPQSATQEEGLGMTGI